MELDPEFDKGKSLLKMTEFFEGFSESALSEVLAVGELRRFETHDHITREGAQSNNLYVILKGSVSIIKDLGRYSRKELDVIQIGECIGEIAFLLDGHRTANLVAAEETFLLRICGQKLKELSEGAQLTLYKKISISLARKLKNNNQLFLGLL